MVDFILFVLIIALAVYAADVKARLLNVARSVDEADKFLDRRIDAIHKAVTSLARKK